MEALENHLFSFTDISRQIERGEETIDRNAAVYVGETADPTLSADYADGLASPLRLTCGMRIRKCTYFV